jgi:hypothetical protein
MQVVEEIRSQLVALIIYPIWFEQHFPGVDVRARSFSNRFASTPSFIILKKSDKAARVAVCRFFEGSSLGFWVI